MTRTDNYDEQIEALLAGDIRKWRQLVDIDVVEWDHVEDHADAWSTCRGLFAYLPQARFVCASMIEHGEHRLAHPDLCWALTHDSPVVLPDMRGSTVGRIAAEGFTESELREFARRQRLARQLS